MILSFYFKVWDLHIFSNLIKSSYFTRKYPAKNICPDCPAQKTNIWVCPSMHLFSMGKSNDNQLSHFGLIEKIIRSISLKITFKLASHLHIFFFGTTRLQMSQLTSRLKKNGAKLFLNFEHSLPTGGSKQNFKPKFWIIST